MSSKGIFLDVDSSIVEKNLRIANNSNEDELSKLFSPQDYYPSKVVKPFPGFCVKTKEIGTEAKFFVNICHTDAIPAPKDITVNELEEILNSEEPGEYRVPMSIGDVKIEKDKNGSEVKTCDIAIHPTFFKKIENIQLFKDFFMAVVFEGISNKHKLHFVDEKIILRNKKAFGTLQVHRIQQRDVAEKMKLSENKSIIDELSGVNPSQSKPLIETISSVDNPVRTPEYRLFKRKGGNNCITGEFKFPDIITSNDLTLDIGEDRILIESKPKGYLLDIFIPYIVRQDTCSSSFDKSTKILTVTMPLVGG